VFWWGGSDEGRVPGGAGSVEGGRLVAGTIGGILNDPRLRARHAFAKRLRTQRITSDLKE